MRIYASKEVVSGGDLSSDFANWLLAIGEGRIPGIALVKGEEPNWIKIPDDLLIPSGRQNIKSIISEIYPAVDTFFMDAEYFRNRSILAPTNEYVDIINDTMLSLFPGDVKKYLSADSIVDSVPDRLSSNELMYPPETLHEIKLAGLPNHQLQLKIGVPVMLIRNVNQDLGMCNGTRLLITRLQPGMIEGEIITGNNIGARLPIPRIVMVTDTATKLPFCLRRVQYPFKVCFAMTINKSQGQTLQHVGVYLPKPVFTHGQLYVALSRTRSREGLRILIEDNDSIPTGYTQNIVYREIFEDL